jgi:hypothetical protein
VVSSASGEQHTLFVKQDASVWALGSNDFGQLGDGTTINRNEPVMILPGKSFSYSLVEGNGANHNHLFTLETNGTLKTATIFDYESNASTYSIRVQAKDEHNATVEGNFTVTVTVTVAKANQYILAANNDGTLPNWPDKKTGDFEFDPGAKSIIATGALSGLTVTYSSSDTNVVSVVSGDTKLKPVGAGTATITVSQPGNAGFHPAASKTFTVTVSGSSLSLSSFSAPIMGTHQQVESVSEGYRLSGEILDDGGSAISERGFLLSTKPNPRVDSSGMILLVAESNASAFSAHATNLQASRKYYFRAYATNAEGTGYGLEETFGTTFVPRGPSWIDAVPGTANNWWSSPWLGSFYLNANGWVRHEKLGWVFPIKSPTAGLWLWKEGFGWLWTNKEIYPFLYQNGNGGWLYFFGRREETLLFYDYSTKRWITRNEGQ